MALGQFAGTKLFDLVSGQIAKRRADALASTGADQSKPVPVEQQPKPEPLSAATTLAPPSDPRKKFRPGAAGVLTGRQPLSGGLL